MNEQSSEGKAERVNEELRDYEVFPAILSLLRGAVGGLGDQPTQGQFSIDSVRAAMMQPSDEERATREAAFMALIARPEMADLVQRIQEVDEERRSRALTVLFASSATESSSKG